MDKITGRILAMAMAVSLTLTGISFPARAGGTDSITKTDAENYSEAETLDEFQEAVSELNEDISLDSDGKYASKRLIVLSETPDFDFCGAESVNAFDGLYALSYAAEQECADAYSKLSRDESVDSVEVDALMEAEEAENGSGGEREAVHTVNTPLKDFLDSKEAEKEGGGFLF